MYRGRKHVVQEFLASSFTPDDLEESQLICRILAPQGSNVFSAEVPLPLLRKQHSAGDPAVAAADPPSLILPLPGGADGRSPPTAGHTQFLVLLPAKFRKLIWIRTGSFVVVRFSPAEAASDSANASTAKVCGVIERILEKDAIRHLRSAGKWPFSGEEEQARNAAAAATVIRSSADDDPSDGGDDDSGNSDYDDTDPGSHKVVYL